MIRITIIHSSQSVTGAELLQAIRDVLTQENCCQNVKIDFKTETQSEIKTE